MYVVIKQSSGLVARRRPTLPHLKMQYHGRSGVSRPSSGWDRVYQPRDCHRATGPELVGMMRVSVVWDADRRCARWGCLQSPAFDAGSEIDRAIRTARLNGLPHVHLRPINVMVSHGPQGDLVLRLVSRLDAFSGYPFRT